MCIEKYVWMFICVYTLYLPRKYFLLSTIVKKPFVNIQVQTGYQLVSLSQQDGLGTGMWGDVLVLRETLAKVFLGVKFRVHTTVANLNEKRQKNVMAKKKNIEKLDEVYIITVIIFYETEKQRKGQRKTGQVVVNIYALSCP